MTPNIDKMERVIHFEIPSDNPEILNAFYEKTFGWKLNKWSGEEYWLAETGQKEVPGIDGAIAKRGHNLQTVVNTIGVNDIDHSIELVKDNGGSIISEIMPIPGVGKFAYFKDPDGNVTGMMEAEKK